ncbi:hypothetical protein C7212DRAFT_344821 [Tuber magnatum]|uniref:Uncharacterized protein n=1 Tax=Tuber magnatum TaxID=42249 RepID=A0A317SQU3_9PEZI|nr:hypothetical protein C7212DRAFT_344821 [Tuber magnatum]
MPPRPSDLLDIPTIRRLKVRRPGFITESDIQILPVGGVCNSPKALRYPSSPPPPAPCTPRPRPGFYADAPAPYRSRYSSEGESGWPEPGSSPNASEPPYHRTSPGRLSITNPDPELGEGEESRLTQSQSVTNSQAGNREQGSSSCNTLFLFQDTHLEEDPSILNQFSQDRANRKVKCGEQRFRIEGVEGAPGAFERPESQAEGRRGTDPVAPHTEETLGERSARPHFNGLFALMPWSGAGPCLWEGPSWAGDDRGYLLPIYPIHQERAQRHASEENRKEFEKEKGGVVPGPSETDDADSEVSRTNGDNISSYSAKD